MTSDLHQPARVVQLPGIPDAFSRAEASARNAPMLRDLIDVLVEELATGILTLFPTPSETRYINSYRQEVSRRKAALAILIRHAASVWMVEHGSAVGLESHILPAVEVIYNYRADLPLRIRYPMLYLGPLPPLPPLPEVDPVTVSS